MKSNTFLYQVFSILLVVSFKSVAQIPFPENVYALDQTSKLIICNEYPETIPTGTTILVFDKNYTLSEPINSIEKGKRYSATSFGQTYAIYFTNIPIIRIGVSDINDIDREVEIPGTVKISDIGKEEYNSTIGIKIRGASTAWLPKLSYRVQLKNGEGKNKDTTLFGLRSDKRWLMHAMYREQTRLNNKISHDLWLKMHKVYYANNEPTAHSSIRSLYAEAFINDRYRGVYLVTEDMDRKQLQLKKTRDDGTVRGELYKGNGHGIPTFDFARGELPAVPNVPSEEWGNWELDYPDETDWQNLRNLTLFVRESTDGEFYSDIANKVHLGNMSDYLIFLNLIRALDNTGKNTFLAKYKENEPYFYVVWDLDATFGYFWDGSRDDYVSDFIGNRLFTRLANLNPEHFKHNTAVRWFGLRQNVLNKDSLHSHINTPYIFLVENGAYEREALLWPLLNVEAEQSYLNDWTSRRIDFLDSYFNNWVESCVAPLVTLENEIIYKGDKATLRAEGCQGIVKWHTEESDSESLAVGTTFTTPDLLNNVTYFASCNIGTCTSSQKSALTITPICKTPNCLTSKTYLKK